jgi:hypothetical protein
VHRALLRDARHELLKARMALREHPRDAARRATVRRLQDRVRTLRARARVAYGCKRV